MAENFKDTLENRVFSRDSISSEVKFERLSLQEEEEYLDFLIEAYKDNFNHYRFRDRNFLKKFWRWEYLDNPNSSQESLCIWICKLKDKMIAQACLMPVELKVKDKFYRAAWCQDVMVLPQFRNTGLGYFILHYLLKGLNGFFDILLVSGTNKNSYALLENMGFADIGFFSRNIKPINLKNITEKFTRKRISLICLNIFIKSVSAILKLPYLFKVKDYDKDNIEILTVDNFNEEFDRFWSDVSKRFSCILKRDAKNLKWRFKDNPLWNYKILAVRNKGILEGYIALREGRPNKDGLEELKVGVISDILFDPRDNHIGLALFDAAIDYFKDKVDLIRCDTLHKQAIPAIKNKSFIGIKSFHKFLVYPLTEELKGKEGRTVKERENWYLTFFDSDLDLS